MAQTEKVGNFKRKRYVVDRALQLSVAKGVLLSLVGVAALWVAGLYLVPGAHTLSAESPEATRAILLKVNAIYFGFAAAILTLVAILATHRIAGPALVFERAVDAMRSGDFSQRLSLRKNDHMKGLAASLLHLSGHLQDMSRRRTRLLEDLARCLRENDLSAAEELLSQLRELEPAPPAAAGAEGAAPAPAPAAAAAPAPAARSGNC